MQPGDLRRVGDRVPGIQRSVRLDLDRQTVKVGPLADACLPDQEVRPNDRIVDRVDTDQVYRRVLGPLVLLRHHETTTPVDPEVQVERTAIRQIVLET